MIRFFDLAQGSQDPPVPPSVVVFPAFVAYAAYTNDNTRVQAEVIADKMVSASKKHLVDMWNNKVIKRFDPSSKGHLPTKFPK